MARQNNNFDRNNNNRNDNMVQNRHYEYRSFEAEKPSWKDRLKEKVKGKAKAFLLGAAYVGVTWVASEVCNKIMDEYENMDK